MVMLLVTVYLLVVVFLASSVDVVYASHHQALDYRGYKVTDDQVNGILLLQYDSLIRLYVQYIRIYSRLDF